MANGGEDEAEVRGRLDRVEGCLIWGLGVPIVLVVVVGLLTVVWSWGTAGQAGVGAKWVASVVIVVGIGGAVWRVLGTGRGGGKREDVKM